MKIAEHNGLSRIPAPFKVISERSAEHLAIRFQELTNITTPSLIDGSMAFLKDYGSWLLHYATDTNSRLNNCVFIPQNPAHSIVYQTGGECLESARRLCLERTGKVEPLNVFTEKFALNKSLLSQPTYTLSGGECALVAMAKTAILMPTAKSAVICSPARWLHSSKRPLIRDALFGCDPNAAPASFLELQGEFDTHQAQKNLLGFAPKNSVTWTLTCKMASVIFPEIDFPCHSPQRRIDFIASAEKMELPSPTLLTGDNGVGKSTFAKVIAGLISLNAGTISVEVGGFSATPRLLFQEGSHQLFALPPEAHLTRAFVFAEEMKKAAREEFAILQERTTEFCRAIQHDAFIGSDDSPNTLLQARLMLAAERLVSGSRLLILDEPAWGLASAAAKAIVAAIIERAHERNIGVLIISHEPQLFVPLFKSELKFESKKNGSEVFLTPANNENS